MRRLQLRKVHDLIGSPRAALRAAPMETARVGLGEFLAAALAHDAERRLPIRIHPQALRLGFGAGLRDDRLRDSLRDGGGLLEPRTWAVFRPGPRAFDLALDHGLGP